MTILRLLVQLRFSFFLILCVIAFESSTVVSSFSIVKSIATTRTQPSLRSYTNVVVVVGGGGAVASLSTTTTTTTTTILFAKKKNTSSGTSKQQQQQVDEIPANLKRKVSAKRDPLGHVIPQNTRSKGGT